MLLMMACTWIPTGPLGPESGDTGVGLPRDTGVAGDTAPDDTAPDDTAPDDTAPDDTAPRDTAPDTAVEIEDVDGDGYDAEVDCDDSDATTNPGADELPYDGLDNDCSEATPDDDLDADGYEAAADCDDADAAINPASGEVAYDSADNDCSEATPDDDLDGDGYDFAADCDDADAAINPAGTELVYDGLDNDCNIATFDDDLDADGYDLAADCDDADSSRSPGEPEHCNGIDDDCDPATDESGVVTIRGASSHTTIQAAIDAASSGATIDVCSGTYAENITISDDVELLAREGLGTVTLDGGGLGAALAVTGGDVSIVGFAVTNGTGALVGSVRYGGGVYIATPGAVTLTDNEVFGNTADYGGGVGSFGAYTTTSVALSNSSIHDNTATSAGGLRIGSNITATLDGVELYANVALDDGGAMTCETSALVTIESSQFYDNIAADWGGAIAIGSGVTLDVASSEFIDNVAEDGGAIGSNSTSVTTVDSCTFTSNEAQFGGALVLSGAFVSIGSVYTENTAAFSGGVAYVHTSGALSAETSIFSDNDASYGTVYVQGNFEADRCAIERNDTEYGGGVYLNAGALTLLNTTVSSNHAGVTGGGLFLQGGTVLVDGAEISDNTADANAGGIHAQDSCLVSLNNSEVSRNTSVSHGAGIYIYLAATIQLDGVELADNAAAGNGGGLYFYLGGSVGMTNSTLLRNTAGFPGGGARLYQGGTLDSSGGGNDWGSGADENSPDDVAVWGGATYLGYGTTGFVCTASSTTGSCG